MIHRAISALLCLSLIGCTGSSAPDSASGSADATNVPPTTSGVVGEVVADELPIAETEESPTEGAETVDTEPTDGQSDEPSTGERVVTAEAMAACALVEAGFIASLDSDPTASDLLSRGATAAIEAGTDPYPELGRQLADSLTTDEVVEVADNLLVQCSEDGFERLAG